MKLTGKIEYKTDSTIRGINNIIAPSCVDCPHAKKFVSVDQNPEKDETVVKITARCERMTMLGSVCPDGGEPGKTYLKDLGIPRKLGEQLISSSFSIGRFELEEDRIGSDSIETMLKKPSYVEYINQKFKEQADENASILHEMTETINFVSNADSLDEPIAWLKSEPEFETFNQARADYITQHIQPYQENMDHSSIICNPTPYMKKYFPKKYVQPFGVMTERPISATKTPTREAVRGQHGNIISIGGDKPPEPNTYIPPPTQEEIYEDWGSFA